MLKIKKKNKTDFFEVYAGPLFFVTEFCPRYDWKSLPHSDENGLQGYCKFFLFL
jgi:hypothetical protein